MRKDFTIIVYTKEVNGLVHAFLNTVDIYNVNTVGELIWDEDRGELYYQIKCKTFKKKDFLKAIEAFKRQIAFEVIEGKVELR